MRSGRLKHLVHIQEKTGTKDSSGHAKDEWQNVTDELVPADIKGLTGTQAVSRSGEYADATHRVEMRFFPGMTPQRRLLFGARVFDILYVSNIDERDRELYMICRERVA